MVVIVRNIYKTTELKDLFVTGIIDWRAIFNFELYLYEDLFPIGYEQLCLNLV